MKKTFALLLTILMLVCLCAGCGGNVSTDTDNKAAEEKTAKILEAPTTIQELIENEYIYTGSGGYDDVYYMSLVSSDKSDYWIVSCAMTPEQFKELENIDISLDDYAELIAKYMDEAGECVNFKNLDDQIPDMTMVKEFEGKTLAEFEADGYWQSSAGNDDLGYLYFEYSDDVYLYAVYPEGGYEDLFSLPEDISGLKIEKIEFQGFCNPESFIEVIG